jgi:hypothetical protein
MPQHSFLGKEELERRVKHLPLPPVFAIDPQTINVKDTPLRFVWSGYTGSNRGAGIDGGFVQDQPRRDNHQILEAIKVPVDHRRRVVTETEEDEAQSEIPNAKQASAADLGRPKFGAHIQDLFRHSYTPPPSSSPIPKSNHKGRWEWVEAARVWDASAERFPARPSEVKRFGTRAKVLHRVVLKSTDSRSFVEVLTQSKMDRRFQDG